MEVDSAEDLASVTTEECFKDADLNHDGRLSIDEFRKSRRAAAKLGRAELLAKKKGTLTGSKIRRNCGGSG